MSIETPPNSGEAVRKLTTAQVQAAVTAMGHDTPCATCHSPDWILATINDTPTILNLTVVNAPGMAQWCFNMTCRQCGSMKLIAAAYVEMHVTKEAQSDV
jgi:hypothetical protein